MLLATNVLKQVLEPLISGVFAGVHHVRDVHHSSSQLEEARLGVVGERGEPHRLKRLVHEFLKKKYKQLLCDYFEYTGRVKCDAL